MVKEWDKIVAWDESCKESKLGKRSWLSMLIKFLSFSSKMTYNVLHPNMAVHLKFSLDQKRWHEVDILNVILRLETLKNYKNGKSYDLLKLAKIHEMTYNLLHP